MAIEFGYCMICHKEIAPKCGDCSTRKPGSQYTEVTLDWSNGSHMPVAVCLDCASQNRHTTADAKRRITEAHQNHWTEKGGTFDKEIVIV